MTQECEILNLLLDRYERSGHCLPGKQSKRRIALAFSRGEYPAYRENDPHTSEINSVIEGLSAEGLISFSWRKGYEGWLLDKVYLELGAVSDVYTKAGRTPISDTAALLRQLLRQAREQICTPWKQRFLDEELSKVEQNLRPSHLLSGPLEQVESILKVLEYTEQGPELMRVISVNCFRDSKYLECYLASRMVSITKAYDPELADYRSADEDLLPKNAVLAQLGILTYPEIFEFCGAVRLIFPEGDLDISLFRRGFCLQSENLSGITKITLDGIQSVLLVENRTNYRHILLHGVPEGQLVVLHGGFYSPRKRQLFQFLAASLSPSAEVRFWGDIDLGGFLMYTRLKKEIFCNLIPHRMGIEDFYAYQSSGSVKNSAYLDSMKKQLERSAFDAVFFPVAHAILETGVTIEQEIML